MTRIEAFYSRSTQYPYAKNFLKLKDYEREIIFNFIRKNEALSHIEFEYAVNRMFLDQEKPKNWIIIQELLVISNSAVKKV